MGLPIYMDYHATTPVDPGVLEAMLPFFKENFGNPASRNHPFGWHAEGAVEASREQVAGLFGARGKEIVFTAGASESNNLAIKGILEARREQGNHIVTCATEHRSVIDTCFSVGLQSVGSFTTSFTTAYGMSPTAYRAALPPAADHALIPACVLRAYGRPRSRTFREDRRPAHP